MGDAGFDAPQCESGWRPRQETKKASLSQLRLDEMKTQQRVLDLSSNGGPHELFERGMGDAGFDASSRSRHRELRREEPN
jgi:hypothetical protein